MAVVGAVAARDAATATTKVREDWVAAVPVTWNVVPNQRNAIEGARFAQGETVVRTVVYRQYTKDFAKQIPNGDGNPGSRARSSGAVSATRSWCTSGTSTR